MSRELLYLLYGAKVVVGIFALSVLCNSQPTSEAATSLIILNAILLPVYVMCAVVGRRTTADMGVCIWHSAAVIALTLHASRDYGFFVQIVGTFRDVHRAIFYMLGARGIVTD